MSRDVIIIGGGASGMMAALAAAENGCRVTLLERQSRVGRKLLATGNGRCNLSNLHGTSGGYHGENPGFALLPQPASSIIAAAAAASTRGRNLL